MRATPFCLLVVAVAAIRSQLAADLDAEPLSLAWTSAVAVRLVNLTWFRPGDDRYTESYGVTTLRKSHVKIERNKIAYYRRNMGVIFQDFKLLATRTVYENIAYALQVTGASRKQIRATLPDILRLTGLSTKLHNYPHQLSGGEQQRVAIARAFASHPPLLLADEPTGNLDPETSIGIMQLLYRINRAGATVIVATHDSEMVDRMRRRVIELKRGRIVRDERAGRYGAREESTEELGERLREAVA